MRARRATRDMDPAHFLDLGRRRHDRRRRSDSRSCRRRAKPTTRRCAKAAGQRRAPDEYSRRLFALRDRRRLRACSQEDFAIWRVDAYGEAHAARRPIARAFAARPQVARSADAARHRVLGALRRRRLAAAARDRALQRLGQLSESEQLHAVQTIHAKFEIAFVDAHATADKRAAADRAYKPSSTPIMARVEAYLAATNSHVPTVYKLEAPARSMPPRRRPSTSPLDRLADGAQMLRDLIADAYAEFARHEGRLSAASLVRDVENGAVVADAYSSSNGG